MQSDAPNLAILYSKGFQVKILTCNTIFPMCINLRGLFTVWKFSCVISKNLLIAFHFIEPYSTLLTVFYVSSPTQHLVEMNFSNINILLSILIVKIKAEVEENNEQVKKAGREGKLFSLFSIVTFKNTGCRSTSGTTGSGINRNGTCYTNTECQNKGGTSAGNCAAG